ncbi:MAG: HAD hydrolase-like protein, partial [Fimbriimonadaceae bacterium]|nr:HAD hydrolase-like protein [Fimbriimonadaceae bacterium]
PARFPLEDPARLGQQLRRHPRPMSLRLAILDLDGTVYRGSEPVEGAAEAVARLLQSGVLIRYLTNNSAARPAEVAAKLTRMGIPAEAEWVIGTGPAALQRAAELGLRRPLIVGEPGLLESAAEAGFHDPGETPDGLITGICRTFDYRMLDRALQAGLTGGPWIATNRDGTYPREGGRVEPGAGAIVGAIAAALGREPDEVIGKPEPTLILGLLNSLGIRPDEAIVVGDRPDTDLEAGRRAGVPTWLVLTGVQKSAIPGQPGSPDLIGLVDSLA